MATAANLPIAADRVGACVRTIVFRGLDLTGVALAMQVRLAPETPGAPLIDLALVLTDIQGLRLASVVSDAGIPVSTIVLRIDEATMRDKTKVPYAGELGAASSLSYDLVGTFSTDRRRLAYGDFVAVPTVYGMNSAPADRAGGGASSAAASWSVATLTFAGDRVEIAIDGAELLAPLLIRAEGAADRAEVARTDATATAASVSSLRPTNINGYAALRSYYPSRDAVNSGTLNADYTVTSTNETIVSTALSVADVARIAAGLPLTLVIPKISGTITSITVYARNTAGANVATYALVAENALWLLRGVVLDPSVAYLVWDVSGACVFGLPAVAYGEPATTPVDAALQASRTVQNLTTDAAGFVTPRSGPPVGTTFTLGAAPDQYNPVGGTLDFSFNADTNGALYTVLLAIEQTKAIVEVSTRLATTAGVPADVRSPIIIGDLSNGRKLAAVTIAGKNRVDANGVMSRFNGIRISVSNDRPTPAGTVTYLGILKGDRLPGVLATPKVIAQERDQRILDLISQARPNESIESLTCYGDSLSETPNRGTCYLAVLAEIMGGVPFDVEGISGQTTPQIAARLGSAPAMLAVGGNAIRADTTPVDAALTGGNPLSFFSGGANGDDPLRGFLGPWPGALLDLSSVRDGGGNVTGLKLTRVGNGGPAVALAAGTSYPFYSIKGQAARNKTAILWGGTNDPAIGGNTAADTANRMLAMYDYLLPATKRAVLLPPQIGIGGDGTFANAVYALLVAARPNNCLNSNLPPNARVQAKLNAVFGWSPDATDTANMAAGYWPTSLRADGVHPNEIGAAAVALIIADWLYLKGWMSQVGPAWASWLPGLPIAA